MIRSCIPASNQKPICLRTDTGTTILTDMNHNAVSYTHLTLPTIYSV